MNWNKLDSEKRGNIAALFTLLGFFGLLYFLINTPVPTVLAPIQEETRAPQAAMSNIQLPADTISIPSLNIEAPLVYTNESNEPAFQEALTRGVVHYPNTSLVGTLGNAYFFGHSSDYAWTKGNYKTVFAHLPEIKLGSDIYISDRSGKIFHYIAKETHIVENDDLSVLAQGTDYTLTLQTSYPVGTAQKRFIVIAKLVFATEPTE